jgi:Ca2+/H+ antiporter
VSGVVAGVLILLYVGALVFTLITHDHLFRTPEADEQPAWSLRMCRLGLPSPGPPHEIRRAQSGMLTG